MNTCKTEQEYINQIAEPARRCCKRYGYLPSVLIAQSCLENGYGIPSYFDNPQIVLLLRYNNMVGIKSELLNKSWTNVGLTVWPGKSLNKDTPEVYKINGRDTKVTANADFRKYDSIEQSFADYLCFMTWGSYGGPGGAPKYGQKVLSIKDPAKLIETVHQLGYATGRTYASNVKRIIAKHDLTRYDDLAGVEETNYYPVAAVEKTKEAEKMSDINIIKTYLTTNNSYSTNDPSNIVVHNTDNFKKGATAKAHAVGLYNGDMKNMSWHYVVDDKEFYQCLPLNRGAWHVGVNYGKNNLFGIIGQRNSIAIEMCVNEGYDYEAAFQNVVKLVRYLMKTLNIPAEHVYSHYDVCSKDCPSQIRKHGDWARFKKLIGGAVTEGAASETYVLRTGSTGEKVTALQKELLLTGFADCGFYLNQKVFVTGTYDAQTERYVRMLQRAAGIDVDGLYGPISRTALGRYVADAKTSSIDFTVETFLKTAKEVAAQNRKNGFSYGNASCLPAVSSEDKLTSCDRFVDQVLWTCGVKDIGNRSVTAVADFLASKGANKITNVSKVKAGDVIFFKAHTFILGNKVSEGIWERYDSGSKERIQLTGAYAGYKSQPFKEGLSGFLYAYRLPFKTQAVTTGSVIYRVQVGAYSVQIGAYSVKANAKKQRDAAKAKGVNAIIRTVKS